MGLEKGSYAMNHCWHDTRSCPVRANCSFMEGHFTCVAWCNLALGANITLLFSSLNNQGIVNSCVATFFIMKKREPGNALKNYSRKKFPPKCRFWISKLWIHLPDEEKAVAPCDKSSISGHREGRTETGTWTLWQNWQQLFTIWSLYVYRESSLLTDIDARRNTCDKY